MAQTGLTRRIALCVGGLAVAGMGLTVGCSAKESPAPTAPAESHIDSKRGAPNGPGEGAQKPSRVKAPAAKTINPAEGIAPGQPGRDNN